MNLIEEAERLKYEIIYNHHYDKCFRGDREIYDRFWERINKLYQYRDLYNNANKIKNEIIQQYYYRENTKKEFEKQKIIKKKEYENKKIKYKNEENNQKIDYENKLQSIINNYNNECLKENNLIIQLEKDISNLEEEIKLLEEKVQDEINLKKIEALNKINNKFKIEKIKYENEKAIEKKKESEFEIEKKNLKVKKKLK